MTTSSRAPLKATLVEVRDDCAVCTCANGKEAILPLELFPTARAGTTVYITISDEMGQATEKELQAREILNTILKENI